MQNTLNANLEYNLGLRGVDYSRNHSLYKNKQDVHVVILHFFLWKNYLFKAFVGSFLLKSFTCRFYSKFNSLFKKDALLQCF